MFRTFQFTRCAAVLRAVAATAVSANAVLGPDGGTIEIPGAGLKLTFPGGALAQSHNISVTAHEGLMGFEVTAEPALPDTLGAPVEISQEIPNDLHEAGSLAFVHVDAVTPAAQIKSVAHTTIVALVKGVRAAVAKVTRFSGYLLASGMNAGEPCDPTVVTDGTCVWVDDGDGKPAPR